MPSEQEDVRHNIVNTVIEILNENFPGHNYMGMAYGSTEYKMCLKDGDLDVCCVAFEQISPYMLPTFAKCFEDSLQFSGISEILIEQTGLRLRQ